MITNDIIIKLKGTSKKRRAEVKDILLKNYMELLNSIETDADFCTVDSYWKNYMPISKPIISDKEFINKFK